MCVNDNRGQARGQDADRIHTHQNTTKDSVDRKLLWSLKKSSKSPKLFMHFTVKDTEHIF